MFRKGLLVVLLLLLLAIGIRTIARAAQDTGLPIPIGNELPYQRGISVVLYGNDSTMAINTVDFFDDLERRNLGVESIIFTFPIFQDGACATQLYEDALLTPSADNIRIFIQEAHRRGITVWLKPLLDDGRLGPGLWRGGITPGCDLSNLEALDAWFASYGELIVKYARIAQEERALGIVVGTEMVSIDKIDDKYTSRWNALIAAVRAVYDGNVTYAKNWSPLTLPGFVDSLDVLMIDAFFDLPSLPDHATEEEIYRAWQDWTRFIRDYQQQLDIPIMFSEIGVVPRVGSYRNPWNGNNGNPFDETAQLHYYQATCRYTNELEIDGLFWWAVGFYDHFENQYERYLRDGTITYNFYDLPAEQAVRDCYLGPD